MKQTYRLHYGDYAVGENELLYNTMADKGWALKKRGGYISSFEKETGQTKQYRIELAAVDAFDDKLSGDNRMSLYKKCGWKRVAVHGFTNVFAAPRGAEFPAGEALAQGQKNTLKALHRRSLLLCLMAPVAVLICFLMMSGFVGSSGNVFAAWALSLKKSWVENTALVLLWAALLIWCVLTLAYSGVRTAGLYRALKAGRPMEHAVHGSTRVSRAAGIVLIALMVLFLGGVIVQEAGRKTYEMPPEADGPYLTLRDVGWNGERIVESVAEQSSWIKKERTLAARSIIHTYESVSTGESSSWMYQDVYEFNSEKQAQSFAKVLRESSVFAGLQDYEAVTVEGLDLAYRSSLEYVAVCGTCVYYVIYSDPGVYTEEGMPQMDYLAALAKRLSE